MTKNATYCDKQVSSRKCIFFVVIAAGSCCAQLLWMTQTIKDYGIYVNMFHCFVIMKVILRLLTIPCNILKLSILRFVIILFEIMLLKETSILSMFVPISNWRIYSPNRLMRKYFAIWEVNWISLMPQTWSRNSIWIHARHEHFYDKSLIFLLWW